MPPHSTCSVPDCNDRHEARGWCNTHYKRWRRHGNPLVTLTPGLGQTAAERFRTKVDRSAGDDACWSWLGARSQTGYGRFWVDGKTVKAHRWAYEHLVGPIPDGLTIDHLCRVRSCVNPAHLEPVSNRVNVLRGDAPAARNARKTHCVRGHEFTRQLDHFVDRVLGVARESICSFEDGHATDVVLDRIATDADE